MEFETEFTTKLAVVFGGNVLYGAAVMAFAYSRSGRGGAAAAATAPAAAPAAPRPSFLDDGAWRELAYWDPMPTARHLTRRIGIATWAERNPLNVPGPFFCGDTHTDGDGPSRLPTHVLRDGEGFEFLFRQPSDPDEVEALIDVALEDIYSGYAWSGDRHWTPEAVRDWWARRDAVREWLAGDMDGSAGSRNAEEPLRAYARSLEDGSLEAYLRGYLFWLTEGREPRLGEQLPLLEA